MSQHKIYMERCLQLALLGAGAVSPNPMVGCVIVNNDRIIGEGWHMQYGQAHAEVNAFASVNDKSLIEESTFYVNLEPCSHHGKTPPCADLLISQRPKKVVIGMIDPFSKVAGKGLAKLKDAGIEVEIGILEEESQFLNRRFIKYHTKQLPYVILKWAKTINGYIAPDARLLSKEDFEEQRKGRSFKIVFKRDEVIEKICDTYADAQEGEKLALFNSADYLEIAINKGNAAGLFGLQGFSEKQNQAQHQYLNNRLFYQTVKVYFE